VPVTTDTLGNKTWTRRDPEGRLLSQTVIDGVTQEAVYSIAHDYNDAGFLVETIDGVGNVTEYLRDGLGRARLETVSNSLGTASWKKWNYAGSQLVWFKNGADSFTWYEYNADGRVTKVTVKNAAGQIVTWVDKVYYPGSGLLWRVTDANSNYTEYTYNGAGQVVTEKTWDTYDDEGNIVSAGHLALLHLLALRAPRFSIDRRPVSPGPIKSVAVACGTAATGRAGAGGAWSRRRCEDELRRRYGLHYGVQGAA
jgi:YD repeat-containing protein